MSGSKVFRADDSHSPNNTQGIRRMPWSEYKAEAVIYRPFFIINSNIDIQQTSSTMIG